MSDKQELLTSDAFDLDALVDYAPGSVVSRTLAKNSSGTITLFAFSKGEGLSPHSAPFDAFVQVVDGSAKITIDDKAHEVKKGQCIVMPADISHSVHAEDDFKMLLIMLKGS